MTWVSMAWLFVLSLCIADSSSLFLPDSKELRQLLSRYEGELDQNSTGNAAGNRTRRAIRWSDREEIVQLHNKLRAGVYPTASNMEYMVRHAPVSQSTIIPNEQSFAPALIFGFFFTVIFIGMCQSATLSPEMRLVI